MTDPRGYSVDYDVISGTEVAYVKDKPMIDNIEDDTQYYDKKVSSSATVRTRIEQEDANNSLDADIEALRASRRKSTPVFSGVLKYFPDAIKYVSEVSQKGNDQHHPGEPLHWDRNKSTDELDALARHLIDHSIEPMDTDGMLHIGKVAWRALAYLQKHLESQEL